MLEFYGRHRYASGFELDVSFEVGEGISALFGPSGCGKTSILEAIAGVRRLESCRVCVAGNVLTDTDQGVCIPRHQRRLGVVFQDLLLFPHLTVEQNIRFGAGTGPLAVEACDRAFDVLEIQALRTRKPGSLSGGERQRVAIARAVMMNPMMLILDEPVAALDESLRHRILDYVERIAAEWSTPVLFVSHSQADVRRLADGVVVMADGKRIAQGPPQEALAAPGAMMLPHGAGPQNVVRIERVRESDGRWIGAVGQADVVLPQRDEGYAESVFVQFSPDAVILADHDVREISVRNHLPGEVIQVVNTPSGVFVAVDVGAVLWAAVTAAAAEELKLEAGRRVTCLIKTQSLHVW